MSENTTDVVQDESTATVEPTTESTTEPSTESTGESATDTGAARPTRRQLLEREGEVAADFLETLLDIADLDGDIDLDIDGDRAAVAVVDSEEGRVPRRLVGQDGKVLEALQELTRLAVQSATGDRSRLMLDVAGHRAARRAELVEIARAAIARVGQEGQPVELDPMSAFERKVVHDEVLSAGLRSDSSGTEPRRFVVVHPAETGSDDAGSDDTPSGGTVPDEDVSGSVEAGSDEESSVGDETN